GEPIPVEKDRGDDVFAGTINELGFLEVETLRVGEDSTLGRILQLVQEAEAHKAPVQRFADRFSAAFLPLVLTAAAMTLVLSHNVIAAIAVLVAACPCAVGLATPLSVVAGVGAGARRGLLIKGGLYLEALAKVDTLAIDKTGTLTHGRPVVSDVVNFGDLAADEVVRLAATLEHYSEHPLATAVLSEAAKYGLAPSAADNIRVLPGRGITGAVDGHTLALGAKRLLAEQGVVISAEADRKAAELEGNGKTVVFLARDHDVVGVIAAADTLRPAVAEAVSELQRLGLRRVVMLTGDNERSAAVIARQAGIGEVAANLLPEDKIATVRHLQAEGRRVAMVGDGINDAPALTQSDVGVAMGMAGTDIALESADVVLLRDDWTQLPEAVRLGRRTYGVIRQNIIFGIAFNVLVMGLAAAGLIGPAIAAASQAVPDVAVALNAARLLRVAQHQDTVAQVTGA
ncbi:MAG: cation-translocating P-type ATPase, partial [Dehalococcoidales bacterium]|nr:cation-translocating P-type ATPase [Dehalococcoidales bacterium]